MNPTLPIELGPVATPGERQDKRAEEGFVGQVMYCLFAPVIVWPGYEADYRDQIADAKLRRLLYARLWEEQQCTEYEAMLYISSASLVAPPGAGWTDIYVWLFSRCLPQAYEANKDALHARPLDPDQKAQLAGLRQWIFQQQVKRMKTKESSETKPGPQPETEVALVQYRLF